MSIAAALCAVLTLAAAASELRRTWMTTPVALPATAWMVALLLSTVFGFDPAASAPRLTKGLFPSLMPLAACHTLRSRPARRAVTALLLSSAVASLYGTLLFASRGEWFPARARGPVGHYMTYGGQLLLFVSLACGIALITRDRRFRIGAAVTAGLGGIALALTFTRSAWLGLFVAIATMLASARRRWLPAFALALVALFALVPGAFRARLYSSFDPTNVVNRERTLMWEAGGRMFRARPITGVGLQDLKPLYDRYRSPEARERPGHLHSVFVQIAATMGIVGLAAFAWLYGSMIASAAAGLGASLARADLAAGVRVGTLGALAGFLVAGCFEWNFGDEELLYTLFVMVGLAWSARSWRDDELG